MDLTHDIIENLRQVLNAWNAQVGRAQSLFNVKIDESWATFDHLGLSAANPVRFNRWDYEDLLKDGFFIRDEPRFDVGGDMSIDLVRPARDLHSRIYPQALPRPTPMTLEAERLLAEMNRAWDRHKAPFEQRERAGSRAMRLFHPELPNGEIGFAVSYYSALVDNGYVSARVFEHPEWKALVDITSKGRDWYEKVGRSRFGKQDGSMQLDSLATTAQPRFFIVYGHDEPLAMSVKNFLQNALKFPEPILLEEQSHSGRTIIEKLEEESASADAAIVLMTPDDLVPEGGKWRARQNVIFELGYFFGRFTRRSGRTIIIYKKTEGIDFPSDLAGIGYVPIHDSIKEASELLRREIRKAFPKSNV